MKLIPSGIRGTLGGVTGIIAGILLEGAMSCAGAQSVAPSQEFRELVSHYVAAWNSHDASILAEFFSADADMIMDNGPVTVLAGSVEVSRPHKKCVHLTVPCAVRG